MKNTKNYFAVFYTEYLYYLPQYLPIAKELKRRNIPFLFVVLEGCKRDIFAQKSSIRRVCEEEGLPYQLGEEGLEDASVEYLICGGNHYPETTISYRQSVLVVHGVGTKAGYFTEEKNQYNIRFVEGDYRFRTLKSMYPTSNVVLENVGFSKLDGVFEYNSSKQKELIANYGLDPQKRTLLYAPTFYPSSLENMSKKFPDEFSEYNIIVKPHFFTFLRKKYRAQRHLLEVWKTYPNVYVAGFEDFSLVPFLAVADLMISDESSAIFEFAALNKPVICNRFIKLRWSYRLFGKRKLKKRMDSAMDRFRDVGENVWKYRHLKAIVEQELSNPKTHEEKRKEYTREIIGPVDGKVSVRMVDILEQEAIKKLLKRA
ncbi:MAG: CDP-glycerol glycerophosphotransferase family protein [Marinifilaceae bacterium]